MENKTSAPSTQLLPQSTVNRPSVETNATLIKIGRIIAECTVGLGNEKSRTEYVRDYIGKILDLLEQYGIPLKYSLEYNNSKISRDGKNKKLPWEWMPNINFLPNTQVTWKDITGDGLKERFANLLTDIFTDEYLEIYEDEDKILFQKMSDHIKKAQLGFEIVRKKVASIVDGQKEEPRICYSLQFHADYVGKRKFNIVRKRVKSKDEEDENYSDEEEEEEAEETDEELPPPKKKKTDESINKTNGVEKKKHTQNNHREKETDEYSTTIEDF